ncbi:ABC transporter permease [bacterium]|nr:MAG: ABC transporter permease [bacterium]
MLWELMKKEMHDQILSLRLQLALLLVLVLMAAGALMFQAEYKRQLADYSRDVSRNLESLAKNASSRFSLFSVFSYNDQFIYRRPNPLGFIAEGHDKDLPNSFRVNAFRLGAPEFTLRGNPLLWRFDNLDWAFIIGVILSFTAIVLVYDSINGEKQRGTLRLMMSHSISRTRILTAKFLSAVIMLIIPLAAGALLSILILGAGGAVPLDARVISRMAICLALGGIYISIFVLVGLLLSARSRTPVVSLVTGLFVWVALVIVLPAAANLLAMGLAKVPAQEQVLEDAGRAWDEAAKRYNDQHPHPMNWVMSGRWSPGEPLRRALEADQAWGSVFQAFQDSKSTQVLLGREMAAFSPSALFAESMESTVESGVLHYNNFLKAARRYQQELAVYLENKYPLDKVHPVDRNVADPIIAGIKLDFGSIPKFADRSARLSEVAPAVIRNAAILALINVVLFAAAFVSFLRYDVR